MAALLATVVALILYGTLYPFHFSFAHHPNPIVHLVHSWPQRFDRGFIRDSVVNIVLFLPLGVTACLTFVEHWSRRTSLLMSAAYGFALSVTIELLQVYIPGRTSSSGDVFFNSIGALAGATLGLLFQRRIEKVTSAAGRREAGPGVVLGICWLGAQLYPLVPDLTRSQIGRGVRYLLSTHLSWTSVIIGAAGWFVFGLALRTIWGKLPWAWLALTMFVVPLRLAIFDRMVSWSDVAAAAAGLAVWCVVNDSMRPGVGWVLMIVAVVVRELAPFHFTGPVQSFSWIPFAASLGSESAPGVTVVLGKAFEYGALVWMLHAGKYRYRTAGILVAIGLLGMELMQTHMTGRVPEITDSVLALLMALVLRLVS